MRHHVPNALTVLRIGLIPPFVAAFALPQPAAAWTATAIFIVAGGSDFLDGWLARRYGVASRFGAFLDPVADKLLVGAALMMLAAAGQLGGVVLAAGVLILMREITISGLREYLAGATIAVPVSPLAKWKTALQMLGLGLLLLAPAAGPAPHPVSMIGGVALIVSAILAVWTAIAYFRGAWPLLTGRQELGS